MITTQDSVCTVPDIVNVVDNAALVATPGWNAHRVVHTGTGQPLAAKFQLISGPWGRENVQMPGLIYMPDRRQLMLTAEYGPKPVRTIATFSNDGGATWSKHDWLRDGAGREIGAKMSVGLTWLGDGQVTLDNELTSDRQFSFDGGKTWTETVVSSNAPDGKHAYHWDPLLVDRGADGKISRLLEACWVQTGRDWNSGIGPYSCAGVRYSNDIGRTWSDLKMVPQWAGVNEVAFIRAANGTIVAACRMDNPQRFIGKLDLYCGLAISVSEDNGETWSELNVLFEYGRHQPSLVMMPDGIILMTYAVRAGYEDTPDGYPQFGIEAVVSRDNGLTWDLDNRYVLATWQGKILGENAWWGLAQSTTTVLLPDQTILTAFGTGIRNNPQSTTCQMDIGLVAWRLAGDYCSVTP